MLADKINSNGDGDGDGYSYGYGYGSGYGSGDGDGYSYGYSSGYGDGDGDGDGYSSGYGDGSGSGDGSGYGSGYGEISISKQSAWTAYHYIRKESDGFKMRNGRVVTIGEPIHEDAIEMCRCGLHAGLSKLNAKSYRPSNSVLTEVLLWGRIIVEKDKVVVTDRQIVKVLGE